LQGNCSAIGKLYSILTYRLLARLEQAAEHGLFIRKTMQESNEQIARAPQNAPGRDTRREEAR